MELPDDIEAALASLKTLKASPGYAMLVGAYNERRDSLTAMALTLATPAEETQQIKRALVELSNHHPDDIVRQLLNTIGHKLGKQG